MEDRGNRNQLAELATDAGGSVTGAAIGLVVGGPGGAIAGAAVGPIATHLAKRGYERASSFWRAFNQHRLGAKTNYEEVAELLAANDSLEHSFMRIMEAANKTLDQRHMTILGEAASLALDSDEQQAMSIATVCEILAQLSPLHVSVLLRIKEIGTRYDEHGVTPTRLIEAFPEHEPVLRFLVRSLELGGLILDNARLLKSQSEVYWEISELGKMTLKLIEDLEGKRVG